MGLLAAIFATAAAWYYPWPSADAKVGSTGEKLFEEFEKQVWSVRLVEYDRETEGLKTFGLQRKGEKWVIPGRSNYPATGDLITGAIASLSEKTILGEESEDQQDHAKFGVLDPVDFQSAKNRDSVGRKITLEDSNRTILGSLIIGSKVEKTKNQYYVRKPGQPKVYIIEWQEIPIPTGGGGRKFAPAFLTTEFADWLDSNMLNLNVANNFPEGTKVKSLKIDNYRINPENVATAEPVSRFRAEMVPGGASLRVGKLEFFENGKWESAAANQTQILELSRLDRVLQALQLLDVRMKDEALAKAINEGYDSLSEENFASANEVGFALKRSEETNKVVGSGGVISVVTDNGLRTNLIFGNITNASGEGADELAHYMMITAEVDAEMTVRPTKPEPKEGESLTEDEEREYARTVENWEKNLKAVTQLAKDTNRVHSRWYYVLGDEFISFLRPELSNPNAGKSTTEKTPDNPDKE